MVLVAALLVLVGLGLFVLGVTTAVTAWYWACVVACGLAAVLLVVARLRAPAGTRVPAPRADGPATTRSGGAAPALEKPAGAPGKPAATVEQPAVAAPAEPPADRPTGRHGRHEAPDPEAPEREAGGTVAGDHEALGGERPAAAAPARAVTPSANGHAGPSAAAAAAPDRIDPPEEDVEVTDLLMVVDLTDEVLVVDEHPRYHLADCPWLGGRETIRLPVDEARTDGFTPCARCGPDRFLADAERARRR